MASHKICKPYNKWEDSFVHRTGKNVFSGTASGIASCLVGYPFDTVKVRLQTQPVHNPFYRGPLDCLVKTLRGEGVSGLYKGVGSPIAGQMFFRATMFTSYFQMSSLLCNQRGLPSGSKLPMMDYFACGAFSGLVISMVEGPIDLFKTKMQVQVLRNNPGSVQYPNVFAAGYHIARTHGIRGVYQGLSGTWLRNIPSFSLSFGCYEIARSYLGDAGTPLSARAEIACGAWAGLTYWIITYPTDVIKSSLQSQDSIKGNRRFHGVLHCARVLYHEEGGWRRFYRGYTPCLLRSIPVGAVLWLVVQKCRTLFEEN